jgi:glycosyltransferase involved in cell wall biosynthesis
MRILLCLTRGDTIGGAQTHVITIANQYVKNNHIVKLVIGNISNDFRKLLLSNNIVFIEIPYLVNKFSPINDVKTFLRINEIVSEFNPDLISLHSTKIGMIGRLLKFTQKSPIVLTVHGWSFKKGVPILKRFIAYSLEFLFARISSDFIVVSKYDMDLAKYLFINKYRLKLIYNGVESVTPVTRDKNQDNNLKIVMIARFDFPKNQKMLIDACAEFEDIELNFIGEGPQLQLLNKYVSNNNFKCKVIFHGQIPNAINEIPKYDIFALISNWEGFPISTLEAMSQGKPIIVSDSGGAAEAVIESYNGYVINDMISLQKAINNFRDNPKLVDLLGANSKIRFEENFSDVKMGRETLRLYNYVLNSNSN